MTKNRGEQTAAALEANLSSLESKLDALLASFGGGELPPELLEEEEEEEKMKEEPKKNSENGQQEQQDKAPGTNAQGKEDREAVPGEGVKKVEK